MNYNGLCCSINGNTIIKLMADDNYLVSYIKISNDNGLNFGQNILISENFVAYAISCSANAKIVLIGGIDTIDNMPSMYISVNYGYVFLKMNINTSGLFKKIITDVKIAEMSYGLNTYICLCGITDSQRIFYSSIKNIDCNDVEIDTKSLILNDIENLNSDLNVKMINAKINIVCDLNNNIFTIHVATYINEGKSNAYIVKIIKMSIFIDGTINNPLIGVHSEFKPLPPSYDVSLIFNQNYITGLEIFENKILLAFHVYNNPNEKEFECGYLYYFNNEWINVFNDQTQLISKTSINGKGISALTSSNNNLFLSCIINSVDGNEHNNIYISNDGFLNYNITTCDTLNYCKNMCMTTNTYNLIQIYFINNNIDNNTLFICSTDDTNNNEINAMVDKNTTDNFKLTKINITQKQFFGFSKNLKKRPNIFMAKLLINIKNSNTQNFDIFINKCFTLQNKKNMMNTYNLFKIYYLKNSFYYKTLINIVNCIKTNTFERENTPKVKKYLSCLFKKVIKYIKKKSIKN